jgi:transcriptional regulator, BolA protein family
MVTPQDIQQWIEEGMTVDFISLDGDGQHFFAEIVSSEFNGLSRIKRHQKVYQILGDKMHSQIHALSMKTLTPEEASKSS